MVLRRASSIFVYLEHAKCYENKESILTTDIISDIF